MKVTNTKKNVCIVHRYFWPENVAVLPQMLKEVVNIHVKKGDNVHVICGSSDDHTAHWENEFGNKVTFNWFQAPIDRTGTYLLRLKNTATLLIRTIKTLNKSTSPDLIYLVSYPPLFAGIVIYYIKIKKIDIKTIYYLQDNHRYLLKNKTVIKYFGKYNQFLTNSATATITLSESMKNGLLNSNPNSAPTKSIEKKVHVVPNYSTNEIIVNQLQEHKKIIDIIYAGNHGVAQNMEYFLDILSKVKNNNNLKISFFGDGTEKEHLIKRSNELNLNIEFNEPIGRQEISQFIAQARFGLVAAMPDLFQYAYPSKLVAYNSMGTKAIIMSESSSLKSWIEDNELGITIDPIDLDSAANELGKLLNDENSTYDSSKVASRSEQFFSKEKYINNISDVLRSIG